MIPFVRLYRTVRGALASEGAAAVIATTLPAIAVGLAVDALGQMIGYAFGVGNAQERAAHFEAQRDHHVPLDDRALWELASPSPRGD